MLIIISSVKICGITLFQFHPCYLNVFDDLMSSVNYPHSKQVPLQSMKGDKVNCSGSSSVSIAINRHGSDVYGSNEFSYRNTSNFDRRNIYYNRNYRQQ